MKIEDRDFRQIYQSYVEAKTPGSRGECPLFETILSSFDPESSREIKETVVAHISQCSYCAQEFDFIREVQGYEQRLARSLAKIQGKPRFLFPMLRKSLWRYASILMIIAVAISGILIFKNGLERGDQERGRMSSLELIQPLDKTKSAPALIFKWTRLPGSTSYIVEIYDEALRPIWESPGVTMNSLSLPASVKQKLAGNKIYFWAVTAFGPDRKLGESMIRSFILTD